MIANKFCEFCPGDSDTWPEHSDAPGDQRNDDGTDEIEQAQDLMLEIHEQIDRAEAAVFRRDWQTYKLAVLNVHDLAGSLWP